MHESGFVSAPFGRGSCMVITMNTWMMKYNNVPEFLSYFDSEQDFVDAIFIQIVMFNFGVWLDYEQLSR